MRSLLEAIDLYRRLIGIQVRSELAYRTSFLLGVLAQGLNNIAEFAILAMILSRFEGIGGWALREIAFLYGMVSAAFGAMDLIFSAFDPGQFGLDVRRGTFDRLLLRPADITLQVLGSRFLLRRLGRIAQGAAIFAVAVPRVDWTLLKVAYLPVVFASIVLFFGALFIIGRGGQHPDLWRLGDDVVSDAHLWARPAALFHLHCPGDLCELLPGAVLSRSPGPAWLSWLCAFSCPAGGDWHDGCGLGLLALWDPALC